MVFAADEITKAVRALLQSVTEADVSDVEMLVFIELAKRRLDRDRPNLKSATVASSAAEDSSGEYFRLTGGTPVISDWVVDFSYITQIINPSPVLADGEDVQILAPTQYQIVMIAGDIYLQLFNGAASGKNIDLGYATSWTINGVESEVTTTISARYENAIEFATAAIACWAKAAEAATTKDSALPGDLINYRSKQSEFNRAGNTFDMRYKEELGIKDGDKPAVAVRGDIFSSKLSSGRPFITHGHRGNR